MIEPVNKLVVHPVSFRVKFLCNFNRRINMIKAKHSRTGSLEMKVVFVR